MQQPTYPMPDIYAYKKSIDKKVITAVESTLKVQVLSAERIKSGEINHVYKIVTPAGLFIARVFRYKKWPEPGKLEWIEQQLSKHKVPHAKIIFCTREKKYFPNGFMISEYVEGLSGTEAVKQKRISEPELYKKFGALARKYHGIKIAKFGPVNLGKGEHGNFADMQIQGVTRVLNQLTKKGILKVNPLPRVVTIINNTLRANEKYIHPCLLHGDMSETNAIVAKGKKVILIDWDNARSGFWLADFIELTRRQMYEKEWTTNPARMLRARNAFFAGYGKNPFTSKDLAALENVLQVVRHIWQMNYYAFDNIDPKKCATVKKIFYQLLKKGD